MPSGGNIDVEAMNVTISENILSSLQPGRYVRISITDTGAGIPERYLSRIFDPFFTTKQKGSGLGLAITKRLAGLLGGQVSLTSEEGKGSVFSLVVPVGVDLTEQTPSDTSEFGDESSTEQSPPQRTAPDPGSRGDAEFKFTGRAPRGRALVAEDTVTNQMLIKLMLERMGLDVTMVKDGAEAVREGLAQSYDLIFMDIQMPEMTAKDVSRFAVALAQFAAWADGVLQRRVEAWGEQKADAESADTFADLFGSQVQVEAQRGQRENQKRNQDGIEPVIASHQRHGDKSRQ